MLQRAMAGARIERLIIRRPKLRYAFQDDFAARVEGQTVRRVRRRAKYLLAELGSGDRLLMHLGMSGWFRVTRGEPDLETHDHVVFEMSTGRTVVFNDPRRFGFMQLVSGAPALLGPEPLDRAFDGATLAAALARRRTPLKAALLDQRIVAGLGNIYACEALHRAALSPARRASTLATRGGRSTDKAEALVLAIKATLRDAIAHHHRVSGEDRFLVYDREGARCPRRGCRGTITRIVQAGRSTFYCRVCQR